MTSKSRATKACAWTCLADARVFMGWTVVVKIIVVVFLILLSAFADANDRKPKVSDLVGSFGAKLDEIRRDCLGVEQIQNEVNEKVKAEKQIDGDELIKQLSNIIRERFANRIAALQELKRGVEEDYARNYVDQHSCCNLPVKSVKYDPRFKAKVDTGLLCEIRSQKSKQSARGLGDNTLEAMYKNLKKNHRLKWQYFGSTEGVTSTFPSRPADDCAQYDNRVRPWYVMTASPAAKNIVIVLDTSTSMDATVIIETKKTTRLKIAKEAVTSLLTTLSPEDQVGVVLFSTKAHLPEKVGHDGCFSTGLAKASSFNVNHLTKFISGAKPGGGTNYKKSFDAAFTLLKDSIDKEKDDERRQSVILFITDGAPVDPSDPIFQAIRTHQDNMYDDNTRVLVLTYGIGTDNKMITFLKRLAKETMTTFKPVENVANLHAKLSTYYEHLEGAKITAEKTSTSVSPPYYDAWGLGVLVTVAIPCFRHGVLKGVAGIDITLTDLLSEVQHFNQAGSDSYAFMAHLDNGITLSHPLMPPPETVTEDPALLTIFKLERGEEFKKFFESLKGLQGNEVRRKLIQGQRRPIPRGGGSEEGIRELKMDYHYYCSRVMTYVACVVIAENDHKMTIKDTNGGDIAYHRMDLVKQGQTCYYVDSVSIKDKAVVKFSAKAFNDPSEYLDVDETSSETNSYMNDLNHDDGKTMFLNNIAETARLGASLEKIWVHSHHKKCLAQIPRRFFGTFNGILKFFPGEPLPQSYDHSNRHWFLKAKNYPNQLTFTTPYQDPLGAGIIISISQSVTMPTTSPNQKNPFGVVAADLTISYFDTLLKNELGFRCQDSKSTTCFLVDSGGYVVFHPRFSKRNVYDDVAIVTNKHITEIHGHIASHLIKAGIMKKRECQDFSQRKLQIYYELDPGNDDLIHNGKETPGRCDTFAMTRVSQTNIFVVAAFATTHSSCYDSTSCYCEKTCSTNTTCECPCTKYLDYDYCNDLIHNRLIPSCTPDSPKVASRPPLPPNAADLTNCFNPKCEEIESESSCRKTFGCSWCKWEDAKEREIPFCSYDNDCYGGVWNRKNPFIRQLKPKTTKVDPTDQMQSWFSMENLTFIGAAAGALLIVIITMSICVYCCCCRKKKKKPSEIDTYYQDTEMDNDMYPQEGFDYDQEYFEQEHEYDQQEYDFDDF